MRRIFLAGVSVAVAALAWAALDDITTGSEPSHRLEWMMVAAAAAWFAGLGWLGVRRG